MKQKYIQTLFFLLLVNCYSTYSYKNKIERPFTQIGTCESCNNFTVFRSINNWFRDNYICSKCGSLPRERAIMHVIKKLCPNYINLKIHESSPHFRGTSIRLLRECKNYTYSHYFPKLKSGEFNPKFDCYCQDIRKTSFEDRTFDLVITQDVMEHVFNVDKAFEEISRILKIGGSHIFTTPIVNKEKPTTTQARLDKNGKIIHNSDPEYHGNPVDNNGSLVTYNFGYDIVKFVPDNCYFTIYHIENKELGLDNTEYNEVCVMTRYKK